MTKILIGSDPEVFLTDMDGNYVSAHDLVPGSKISPFGVPKGAVQPDGVAAEFNIIPAESADEFVDNIRTVMDHMMDIILSRRGDLQYAITPTAVFSQEYFDALPKKAKLLGCEPDFNAYTGKQNPKPRTKLPMRTGAGHIHIGFTSGVNPMDLDHFDLCRRIVKQMDAVLYPMSMSWDSDETRRELYGARGSFRPKHYGLEYRPLSNAILLSDDILREVYSTTVFLVESLFDGKTFYNEEIAA